MAFKICLAGCGAMAWGQHGPAIKRYEALHDDVRFSACCDINGEQARKFKESFGLDNDYTDMEAMLSAEKPQAVSLIVPVERTMELSCRVLAMGFPLITEKPPGLNVGETRRMMEAAGDIPNQVAFNRRYMPLVQKARALIGGTDSITDIRYRMARVRRPDPDFSTTAIHGIDLVKYLSGNFYRQLHFTYRELPEHGPGVANFHLSGRMGNGIVVHLDFLPMSGVNTERLEINTTRGLYSLRLPIWEGCYDGYGRLDFFENNIRAERIQEEDEWFILGGFYHENAFFFDDLRNGKKPEGDIASGLQAVDVADCIRRREAAYTVD
jgi:predicted dehydrogenase